MGAKKDELYARLAKARTSVELQAVLEVYLPAARREEQDEREACEDAYWDKFSDLIDEHPIGHPRLCGLPGCHGD